MIYLGSRYEDASIEYILDARRNETRATVFRSPVDPATDVQYWWWREEDRIDLIALKFFNTPEEWWRILDANPEILDPNKIAVGTKIKIPR